MQRAGEDEPRHPPCDQRVGHQPWSEEVGLFGVGGILERERATRLRREQVDAVEVTGQQTAQLIGFAPPLPRPGSAMMLGAFYQLALLVTDGEPEYAARIAMLAAIRCSMVRFHSLTVGVFAAASTPCGAKVLQFVGKLGLQAGGGCTPWLIGKKLNIEPVNVTEALYGGRELRRNERLSMSV